ncbi:MAG: hypothetical protein ABI472_02415 [Ginsengibacter sp.]
MFLLVTGLYSNAQVATFPKWNNTNFLLNNKLNSRDSLIHFVSPYSVLVSYQQVKPPVTANFTTCSYGFFCREELVIEKATRIPLRLRLGSLQQCNYYEGKR